MGDEVTRDQTPCVAWQTYIFRTEYRGLCRYAWRISQTPINPDAYLPYVAEYSCNWGFAMTRWGARRAIRSALRDTRQKRNPLVEQQTFCAPRGVTK